MTLKKGNFEHYLKDRRESKSFMHGARGKFMQEGGKLFRPSVGFLDIESKGLPNASVYDLTSYHSKS